MYLRKITFIVLFFLIGFSGSAMGNTGSVVLYTPFTKISVPPGQSVSYSISIINKSGKLQRLDVSVWGLSRRWDYQIESGGLRIQQISILPNAKEILSLKLRVPLKINKGNYRFFVKVGKDKLPLTINVSKRGTYNTLFTSNQKNMMKPSFIR